MAEKFEEDSNKGNQKVTGTQLLDQVMTDLNKQNREAAKGRLKNLVAEREACERALNLCNEKINKFLAEYEAGTLVFDKKDQKGEQKG